MKVCLISTHSFPLPFKTHTGDIVILDLAEALQKLGHQVWLCAPRETEFTNLLPMPASYGKFPPSSQDCEMEAWANHKAQLLRFDMVHDFSNTKCITQQLNQLGQFNTIQTLMGGAWTQPTPAHNLITWSKAHQERVSRGATDYEGTPTPDLAGANGFPTPSNVVYGGVDTDFYCPEEYQKGDFHLWLGRWHPVRGYKMAIEIAKETGEHLLLAGEDPKNLLFEAEKEYAHEALELAKGCKNIRFCYLPEDPNHHLAKRTMMRRAKSFWYTVQFHEPFGLSQVEAMACGTPVIATNYGSMPEIISESDTGFTVNNDLKSFTKALNKLKYIDPQMCRRRAVAKFDISVMAKNYVKEYQRIIEANI